MVQVIKQPRHTHEVVTREGEVKILLALEITLNVNTDGIQVGTTRSAPSPDNDTTNWAIPSFKSDKKIQFGKQVEE